MKTLRQVHDQLRRELEAMLKAGADLEHIKTRVMDTAAYIENCSDEEFEHLGTDVPEAWDR